MSKDKSKQGNPGSQHHSPLASSLKILLIILVLVLIPLSMRELDVQTEHLALIGRIVGALCLTVLVYGLMKQATRIVLILAAALIVVMVLASEGLIDLPRLTGR